MFEQVFASLPAGIATASPGPVLGALLDQVDPHTVSPHDAITLAVAWRRQLSHHEARYARAGREAALADPDAPGGRREGYGEFGGDELRAVLSKSRTRVGSLLSQADTAIATHPTLWAAWDAGRIDTDRVRICITWTSALSSEHAAQVIARVLPEAPRLTLGGLIERIQQLATALDPAVGAAALRSHPPPAPSARSAHRGRHGQPLRARDLPLDAAARSVAHVETLALRAKAAGHPGRIDTIRADVYLALLRPRTAGLDDDALVAAVVANADPTDPRGLPAPVLAPGTRPGNDEPGRDHPGSDASRGADSPGESPGEASHASAPPIPAGCDDATPGGATGDETTRDATGDEVTAGEATCAAADADGQDAPSAGVSIGRRGGTRRSRIELRVGLLTLLGDDEKPAMMPGYGVVHSVLARHYARQLCAAQWRVAVTDVQGRLVAALLTRRRPRGYASTPPDDPPITPRPVLELHVTEIALVTLRPAQHPLWADVLTDLQDQYRQWRPPPDDPADGRVPPRALARWIQMRDRTCVFPPCRTPALASDIDHTLAVAARGPTSPANLGPGCRHDHRLKDEAGWQLEQPQPGSFTWTSPTRHTYQRPPRPVLPEVPDPAPGRYRSSTTPVEYATDDAIWATDPYPEQQPPHPPPDQSLPDQPPGQQPREHGPPHDPPPF